jgi:acetyl-CoA carboxylase biotin carboxyl carrier protein
MQKDPPDGVETGSDSIDTRLVRRLASILKDTGLSEIEVQRGDVRIRVAREITYAPSTQTTTYALAPTSAPAPAPASAAAASAPAAPAERRVAEGDLVKSPMVGTVYLQSQPGSPPFAKVGDKVAAGQTLLIIEAMKTMNPVPSPRAGVVAEILIEDSQPVEYGAPLVVLE